MSTRLTILYEDSRASAGRFALHDLVLSSAADLVERQPWELVPVVVAVPCNGALQVLARIVTADRFLRNNGWLLAWLDNDKIRRALGLSAISSASVVSARIKQLDPGYARSLGRVEVFLLEDNLEDLIRTIQPHLPSSLRDEADRAVRLKRVNAREGILYELARPNPRSNGWRATLRQLHPNFASVSQYVGAIASAPAWPL